MDPPRSGSVKRWLPILALLVAASLCAQTGGVRLGMSPAEAEAALGRPTSTLMRGERSIWLYPDSGRLEFAEGRVVAINQLPVLNLVAEPPPESVPEPESIPTPVATGPATTVDPEMQALIDEQEAFDPNEATRVMQKFQEPYMQTRDSLRGERPSAARIWGSIALEALFHLLVTMLALKAAFKWTEVPAEWRQMVLPALADVLTKTAVVTMAALVWHTDQVFYVDYALSYFALLVTLRKTTHATSLQRAVSVAMIAKVANVVLWALVSVLLLQQVFG